MGKIDLDIHELLGKENGDYKTCLKNLKKEQKNNYYKLKKIL